MPNEHASYATIVSSLLFATLFTVAPMLTYLAFRYPAMFNLDSSNDPLTILRFMLIYLFSLNSIPFILSTILLLSYKFSSMIKLNQLNVVAYITVIVLIIGSLSYLIILGSGYQFIFL